MNGSRHRPIRRVLLIFPPTRLHREGVKQAMPPMGAASLAAIIRDRCEVAILDAVAEGFDHERPSTHGFFVYGLPMEDIYRRIRSFAPDLVGMTCLYSSVFPVVAEICGVSKRAAPDALTIAGGTHPSFLPEQCLAEVPELDMIALGEGEPVILDLLDALNNGRDPSSVDGLAYRTETGIRVNPKTKFVDDLDTLPLPARDLLPMERYQEIGVPHLLVTSRRRFATVITSRGCPARCTFCSSWRFWGSRYRARSAEHVLAELEHLVAAYGIREVQFEDDNITLNPRRFRALLDGMIQRRLDLSWSTPNGIALWAMDRDTILRMKAAGCYEVTLAFESGCQDVLDTIVQKPLNLAKAAPLVRDIQTAGIRTSSFFIVGFPGETLDQMRQTFALPRKLGLTYAWFFIANPLPGTELYEVCRRNGYLREGFDFVNNSFSRCNIKTDAWEPRDVERLAHREFLKFNFYNLARHPRTLLQRYRSMMGNPRLVGEIIRGLVHRNIRGRYPAN
ncbi:MAG: B12-binding domain-containing radical SAM protein [Candidatus Eisenbacteria bacterium]|nr:B12-binding domain-containing radical SAM protein [Candidatus Eisenbacteria bacterium]